MRTTTEKIRTRKSEQLPAFTPPELALLVDEPPSEGDWVHEVKFDGYRIEALKIGRAVKLLTRKGLDWSSKYATIAESLKRLNSANALLDGEIVWLDERGISNFQQLQNFMRQKKSGALIFYVFDLLFLNGVDLTQLPLLERKHQLKKLLRRLKRDNVRFSDHSNESGEQMFKAACKQGLEGIVSKHADSPYRPGRHSDWVKVKCKQRQEFVIGGFTEPEGSRVGFGSLLLGYYENEKLIYAGRCGTGFDSATLRSLHEKLRELEISKSPFSDGAPSAKSIHWVRPKLVAEVSFAEWTSDKILRVPVFHGLRIDKSPKEIVFEKPSHA